MREKKITLWERFNSDKPSFFKRTQLIGLAVAALATSLTSIPGVPGWLIASLASGGAAIAAVSQFAVNTANIVNDGEAK